MMLNDGNVVVVLVVLCEIVDGCDMVVGFGYVLVVYFGYLVLGLIDYLVFVVNDCMLLMMLVDVWVWLCLDDCGEIVLCVWVIECVLVLVFVL